MQLRRPVQEARRGGRPSLPAGRVIGRARGLSASPKAQTPDANAGGSGEPRYVSQASIDRTVEVLKGVVVPSGIERSSLTKEKTFTVGGRRREGGCAVPSCRARCAAGPRVHAPLWRHPNRGPQDANFPVDAEGRSLHLGTKVRASTARRRPAGRMRGPARPTSIAVCTAPRHRRAPQADCGSSACGAAGSNRALCPARPPHRSNRAAITHAARRGGQPHPVRRLDGQGPLDCGPTGPATAGGEPFPAPLRARLPHHHR